MLSWWRVLLKDFLSTALERDPSQRGWEGKNVA
jgi:hypothetical protein